MSEPLIHEIPLANLLPIQRGVSFVTYGGVIPIGPKKLVETVLYEGELGDPEAQYILFDGHHRSYKAHLLGESAIAGRTLTEDRHVLNSAAPSLSGCASVVQARENYRNVWLPIARNLTIATLGAWAIGSSDATSYPVRVSASQITHMVPDYVN